MIQMMIEADTHEEFVTKLKGLAGALGSTEKHEPVAAPAPERSEPQTPSATEGQEVDGNSTQPIPNPTKATVALAEEKGVDLAAVAGTGKNGRVTQKDVLAFAAASPSAGAQEEESGSDESDDQAAEEPADTPAADPFGDDEAPAEPAPATDIEPTAENTTAALKAVNAEKGMDVCVALLSEYECRRVSEVSEAARPQFIESCADKLGITVADLAGRIQA